MKRTHAWLCMICALVASATACGEGSDFQFGDDFDSGFGRDDAGRRTLDAGTDGDEDGGDEGSGSARHDAGVSDLTDGSVSPGDDAGVPQSIADTWPAAYARALCNALADCYHSDALLADVLGGQDCQAVNENLLSNGDLRYLPDSVAASLVSLHPDMLDKCVQDVRALGCAARAGRLPASCRATFQGTLLIAGECTINLDCQGEAFCDKGELASCPGVCSPLQAEGFPCNHNDNDQCKDGLVCFRGTCEALGEVGQSCGGDNDPSCRPGLICIDGGCDTLDALYMKKLGEACDGNTSLCEPGLVCESVQGAMGVCAKTAGAGGSCKRAKPSQCPIEQYCDATAAGVSGTCVDRPLDGQACLPENSKPQCSPGNLCVDGMCHAIGQIGAACASNAECYSRTCGDDGQCAAPLMCEAP
jgi:hypothetical protein